MQIAESPNTKTEIQADVPEKGFEPTTKRKGPASRLTPLLAVGLLIMAIVGLSTGAYELSVDQILQLFAGGSEGDLPSSIRYLLLDIRLPRVLLAVIVGAGLSVSGAAIQGLFRNPLADPTLIGITSGGMLFAILGIFFSGSLLAGLSAALGYAAIAFLSFLGSLITTLLIFRMATFGGKTYVTTMLLAGIAITALAGSVTGLLTYFSSEDQLRDITFWTLGSLSGANWTILLIVTPAVGLAVALLIRLARSLDLFMLGEGEAAYLGVNVQRTKWTIIICTALAVGISVSVTGIISFIALVVPHLLRLLSGARHRPLLINSALLGGGILLLADTAARTLIAPAELPIGVLTALLGAPFFIWMLMRARGRNSLTL